DLAVELLVGQRAGVARLAFPEDRGLVLAPTEEVPVETVEGGVDLAAREPLGERGLPDQGLLPRLEPGEMLLGHAGPELLGRAGGLGVEFLVLGEGLDVGLAAEGRRRLEM